MSAATTREAALDSVLDATTPPEAMAGDLFGVVDALESSPSLRRALTDPGTPEQARRDLAHGLLDGKVSEAAADLVAEGSAMRWAGGRTFAAALERQAVRALLQQASSRGQLEEVEDELFRFSRTVDSSPELRSSLGDRSASLGRRRDLVSDLLDGKVSDTTVALARRAVGARNRTFGHTLENYIALAANQKNRVIATVRVARPITVAQAERLRVALSREVGREVALQVVVDPGVIGGARVELGDEVVEGTVSSRLEEARRLFS